MLVIEPATALRFPAGSFDSSCRRLSHSGSFFIARNNFQRLSESCCTKRNNFVKGRVRASSAEEKAGGPLKQNAKPQRYHPSEDIGEAEVIEIGEARLTPAETARTVIEVNSKAVLMFSGSISDEVHDNIFWPDLPYVTDEHGNIYFQVKNDEDILQTLTAEDTLVQVIIGLDTTEMLSEMELLSQTEVEVGFEDVDSDYDSDEDDDEDENENEDEDEDDENGDYEEDWAAILDDEEEQEDSDESPGDWAKLETMRSSHPIYFAKKLAEMVGVDPIDYMEQPPAGLAIQGLLRPAFVEEHSVIHKQISDHKPTSDEANQVGKVAEDKQRNLGIINGHRHSLESSQDGPNWSEELEKGESFENGTSFYKLENIRIQLISAHGNQTFVELEDFRRAQPDAIAHSAAKIISRLKASEEKTTHALKSFCWRCKGIQAEEVALIGVDSLGFDLRVCSGTQVQTLRFAFNKRASSEYSAERQLNDLLFPRIHSKQQKKKEAHQSDL